MKRFIIGNYAIGVAYVTTSNMTNYHPNNIILDNFWNLPDIKTDYGKNIAIVTVGLAPFLIPIYCISVPILFSYDKMSSILKN